MRLALFTNQFPAKVSTFIARDMQALLAAGVEIDLYPIYPLDSKLWRYVPDGMHRQLPRGLRLKHRTLSESLRTMRPWRQGRLVRRWLGDSLRIVGSAVPWGPTPLAKSAYVLPKAWAWAAECDRTYDHVLSYWGNYAATSAYVFHRLTGGAIPWSIMLHAGTDLYRSRVFLREKLLYADRIFVVCQFNRDYLRRCFPDLFDRIAPKIVVHHLGLDVEKMHAGVGRRASHTVVAVGGLGTAKGFDTLIEAIGRLVAAGKDVRLELLGDGPQRRSLENLADRLGLQGRVRFRGWCAPEEVLDAMRSATMLVHPSSRLGDAVPTVIKEALTVGTPVVASRVAGIPELLDEGRCGKLTPPGDATQLATAIAELLTDEPARRDYAIAGRKFAERTFHLWRNGRRLARLLRETRRGDGGLLADVAPDLDLQRSLSAHDLQPPVAAERLGR